MVENTTSVTRGGDVELIFHVVVWCFVVILFLVKHAKNKFEKSDIKQSCHVV